MELKKTSQQPVQMAFWELLDPSKTNMVALYDLAPRFVFDIRGEESKQKMIEREFTFCDQQYKITIKPTPVQTDPGNPKSVVDRYLGEREQIVEEVIRRLASNRNRLTLHGENKVRFPFTLHEVREELKRVKHTYSLDEIREAITLLNEVRLSIVDVGDKKSPLLSAPAFPVMGMRKRDDDEDRETFVEFNPLVADAIRMLSFQQVSYDLLMEIRDPVARWLLKRLHLQIAVTTRPVQEMTATEIRRDSGMPEWKTTRNLLRRVQQAVEVLRDKGILDLVEAEDKMSGQRKEDIIFTMRASKEFLAEVTRSTKIAQENLQDFARFSDGKPPGGEFKYVENGVLFDLRDERRRRDRRLSAPAAAEE